MNFERFEVLGIARNHACESIHKLSIRPSIER